MMDTNIKSLLIIKNTRVLTSVYNLPEQFANFVEKIILLVQRIVIKAFKPEINSKVQYGTYFHSSSHPL